MSDNNCDDDGFDNAVKQISEMALSDISIFTPVTPTMVK
jgi:hypothetical protein